ncbi:precorrin-2 dehydrogenase/sirohydrochlorin ferrochelatase [Ancylomarina subtilis]|uniref:precorrin-2 dehydrogenase n=1 Tax=Ancylomarina subtilis TaxID=1639035 RepID=A0A4Q7VK57_9BACT|nr:bifunctional precorrin-2 dehydrogenase/sirohydrochlorin ferrochelatase [Ancylomarina subtilis]RZT96398.1 precorrin-2 dehydrogenase/sirohydrochlorin ferrochelatase [Ancylomarina subtilis]
MSWYPVSLNLKGRNCLVVGGGKVAERKLKSLIKAEAEVTLIAPNLSVELQTMHEARTFHYLKSTYQKNDVNGFFLVIAATDCSQTNSRIGADAEAESILFNSVNSRAYSNFYPAAASQCGDIQIAVSSNGQNPYLAKKIRKYLDQKFDNSLKEEVMELGRLRNQFVKETTGLSEKEKKAFMKDNLLEKVEAFLDKIDGHTWEL